MPKVSTVLIIGKKSNANIIEIAHRKAVFFPLCCITVLGLHCSNLLIRLQYLTSARRDCPSDKTVMTYSIMVDNGFVPFRMSRLAHIKANEDKTFHFRAGLRIYCSLLILIMPKDIG